MKTCAVPFASIVIAVGLAATPAAAGGLDCGKPPASDAKIDTALSEAIATSRLDTKVQGSLAPAIRRLISAGVARPLIVDHAVAAYCPLVAKDDSLPLDRKREAIRQFAATMTSLVYDPLDPNERAETAVIVSLPVEPGLSEQIDVAAAKAGQTRDGWILQAIRSKLTGG